MADSARDARFPKLPDDPGSMNYSTTVHLADNLSLTRMGYGAIQLAGPMAWGPPKVAFAIAALIALIGALVAGTITASRTSFEHCDLRRRDDDGRHLIARHPSAFVAEAVRRTQRRAARSEEERPCRHRSQPAAARLRASVPVEV